jgi:hypothetical protein
MEQELEIVQVVVLENVQSIQEVLLLVSNELEEEDVQMVSGELVT